jgi:putative membrane protein
MYLAALLHPLERIDGWTSWSIHPSTVIGIAVLGGLYAWRSRTEERGARDGGRGARIPSSPPAPRPSPPSSAQRLSFALGLLVLFVSLNGPIHDLSDVYLFSVHMVQHLLLTMLVIPLLLAGTTGAMLRPALRVPGVAAVARAVTEPRAAFLLFNGTLAVWHIPAVYDLAMRSHAVHIAQHLCFLVAATLMWWPLMSPLPELPRLSYPKQMLYTFLLMLPMSLMGMVITYAQRVLYPAYQTAPRLWGISPMEDQLIGGLVMWIPGTFILIGVLSSIFFRWSARQSDETAAAQVA